MASIAQVNDLHTAVVALIIIVVGGIGGLLTTLFVTAKWYIPRRFEQQTKEREERINSLKQELENKRAAEAVDIERDRLLPQVFANNQMLASEAIAMAKSFNATMELRNQQDAIIAATMTAHDKQLTTNTERLEENTEKLAMVESKVETLYSRFLQVFPRDTSIIELFDELKGVVEDTKKACEETKHKTGELPPIIPVTNTPPVDDLPKAAGL